MSKAVWPQIVACVITLLIVTYVPYGMDATVSWDQPDFRFRNNHKYPVKISMSFEAASCTYRCWGQGRVT